MTRTQARVVLGILAFLFVSAMPFAEMSQSTGIVTALWLTPLAVLGVLAVVGAVVWLVERADP